MKELFLKLRLFVCVGYIRLSSLTTVKRLENTLLKTDMWFVVSADILLHVLVV